MVGKNVGVLVTVAVMTVAVGSHNAGLSSQGVDLRHDKIANPKIANARKIANRLFIFNQLLWYRLTIYKLPPRLRQANHVTILPVNLGGLSQNCQRITEQRPNLGYG